MHRTLARLVSVVAVAVTALAGFVAASSAPAGAATNLVVVYGDSLVWEAKDYTAWLGGANGMPTLVKSFGGTATCDWFRSMRADLRTLRPKVVILAFSGNNMTPCMRPRGRWLTGDALERKYVRDTSTAVVIARSVGAKVLLVGAPRSRGSMGDADWDRIHDAYRTVARGRSSVVRFVDGGRLIAPNGRFRAMRGCLPPERSLVNADGSRPCTRRGLIDVRAPDGAHFCPRGKGAVNGVTGACPRYASGAYRYASTMVREAHRAIFRRYP
jgi:hypothetical protein